MSKASDRQLGVYRHISRRDFLNGVGVALTGAMLPPSAFPEFRMAQAGEAEE